MILEVAMPDLGEEAFTLQQVADEAVKFMKTCIDDRYIRNDEDFTDYANATTDHYIGFVSLSEEDDAYEVAESFIRNAIDTNIQPYFDRLHY